MAGSSRQCLGHLYIGTYVCTLCSPTPSAFPKKWPKLMLDPRTKKSLSLHFTGSLSKLSQHDNVWRFLWLVTLFILQPSWVETLFLAHRFLPLRNTHSQDLSPFCIYTNLTKLMLSFILLPLLREVHSLFQSQFYIQCDLVLLFQFTLSSSFPNTIQQLLTSSSSSSRHFYPSLYLSFSNVF
jgi:hypothetical protein